MADITNFTPVELLEALSALFVINPLAQFQISNIILTKRLTVANAEVERLKASPTGAIPQGAETART